MFRTYWPKMGFISGQIEGRGGAMVTPNELVSTFWGSYVCANFGENRSEMRPWDCAQTDTQIHWQTQTGFISERELTSRSLYVVAVRLSVCLSFVCNVRALHTRLKFSAVFLRQLVPWPIKW